MSTGLLEMLFKRQFTEELGLNNIEDRILDFVTVYEPNQFVDFVEKRIKRFSKLKRLSVRITLGETLVFHSEYKHAKALLSHTLQCCLKSKARPTDVVTCLGNLGVCCMNLCEYNKAIEYLTQGVTICQMFNIKAKLSTCLSYLGDVYRHIGDLDSALELQRKALEISLSIEDGEAVAVSYSNIASIYNDLHNSEQATIFAKKALEFAIKADNKMGISISYSQLGTACFNQKEYEEALDFYLNAQGNSRNLMMPSNTLCDDVNIANCYLAMKRYDDAIPLYQKALVSAQHIGDTVAESTCFRSLGCAQLETAQFIEALESIEESLKLEEQIGIKERIANTYSLLALANRSSGNYQAAIVADTQAIHIYNTIGNDDGLLDCSVSIGTSYHNSGDEKTAVEKFEEVLNKYGHLSNLSIGTCHAQLGECYILLRDTKKAIDNYDAAIRIFAKVGDKKKEFECYTDLGDLLKDEFMYSKAEHIYKQALEISLLAHNQGDTAKSYASLGVVYMETGDIGKAMDCFQKALDIDQSIHNMYYIACDYINISGINKIKGEYDKAIENINYALKIAEVNIYRKIIARCYNHLGVIYHTIGDFSTANESIETALSFYESLQDDVGQSSCYFNMAINDQSMGNIVKAKESFELSYKFDPDKQTRANLFEYYINRAILFLDVCEYGSAYEYIEIAGKIALSTENKRLHAGYYDCLGAFYRASGDFSKALEFFEKALDDIEETHDKALIAGRIMNIGSTYMAIRELNQAIWYMSRAYLIFAEIGNFEGEAVGCLNLGIAYFNLQHYEKAKKNFSRAIEIYAAKEMRSGFPACYAYLGRIACLEGQYSEAIRYFDIALDYLKGSYDIRAARRIFIDKATLYLQYWDKPELAYSMCKEAIINTELLFESFFEEKHRMDISDKNIDIYKTAVDLAVKLKHFDEAYQYLEKAKSRTFLKLLGSSKKIPAVEVTPEYRLLLEEEERLVHILTKGERQHEKNDNLGSPSNLEVLIRRLEDTYKKIEAIDPKYVSIRKGTTIDSINLQKLLRDQYPHTTLIEYYIANNAVNIFVFSSCSRQLHFVKVDLSEERLNNIINENYRKSIPSYQGDDLGNSWLELSQYLTEPISSYIQQDDTIIFIPYGILHSLPLHALTIDGEHIIMNHSVKYLPSGSLLRYLEDRPTNNLSPALVVGFDFEDEAREVSAVLSTAPIVGNAVNKEHLLNDIVANRYGVVHFSCHGLFDKEDPMNSGIQLSNDEILTAREILHHKMNVAIVTLSACDTGLNEITAGDELIGLERAFLYAGATSILVCLWKVDATASVIFMSDFYKELKLGHDKASALRIAQTKMMSTSEYRHPYYWAPYVLVGI